MQQKYYLLIFFILACLQAGLSQSLNTPSSIYYSDEDNKGIVYDKEFTVDLKLHTNGYALGFNIARLKTYYLTQFYNIEIGEIKHHKEYRQSFDFQTPSSSRVSRAFVFGKQNNFFVLRAGFGEKRYFSEKAKRKGLAVGITYEAGPSLGFLKPYYLELIRFANPGEPGGLIIESERFSEATADEFLDINRIYGSAGFSKGLNEISIIPGAHAKAAVHFDWGAFDQFVKAIEAGIMFDFYFQNVPIMVESEMVPNVENRPFFLNFFINLQLGKRW